jgi:hypothetical protein
MQPRPPRKIGTTATRRAEPVPVRLDDLTAHLGTRLAPIRDSLESEGDLAVVMADRIADGDRCVIVVTRSAVHVSCFGADATGPDEPAIRIPWAAVRVSPMRLDPDARRHGTQRYACEVLVGDARFQVVADPAGEPTGVEAFHDEIVRRGTPWHYPR